MKSNKIGEGFIEHIHKNLILYLITLLFLCIGIVVGTYTIKYMDKVSKNNLIDFILKFSKGISPKNINKKDIFLQAVKNNMFFILIIWFLGLTMLGTPIILICDLFKGFTIGFTSSLVINGLGAKGILVNLLTIVPQNIIYIPCIIVSSVISIGFSLKIFKNSSNKFMNKNNNVIEIAAYSSLFLGIVAFMVIGFFIESYVSPNMLKLIAYNVGSGLL